MCWPALGNVIRSVYKNKEKEKENSKQTQIGIQASQYELTSILFRFDLSITIVYSCAHLSVELGEIK